MRALPVLVVLVVVAAGAPLGADAAGPSGPIVPTIATAPVVSAGRLWGAEGHLVANTPGSPSAPLANVNVSVYRNGTLVDWDTTDALGKYRVRVLYPVGTSTLEARIFEGTPSEGRSAPFVVNAYPTWPVEPGVVRATYGFQHTEAVVTWVYPWNDGGYPVTSYDLERSTVGANGPWTHVFSGYAHRYVDPTVVPNASYWYRARAHTSWGTGNWSNHAVGYHSDPVVVSVDLLGYRICEDVNCTDILDGGNVLVNASANVTVVPWMEGIADHYPISPPGVPDVFVLGRVELPFMARNFSRWSDPSGNWHANATGYWTIAPGAGCLTVPVVALTRHANQGHMQDNGSFDLCV